MAAALKKEPGVEVELVNGNRGELTVLVDGRTVAQNKDHSLPSQEEVLNAVRNAEAVTGR